MNKKGFMMAEVVVVSAIVIGVISGLYVSYNKIYSKYKTLLSYNDTTALYRLGYYRDILIENNAINDKLSNDENIQTIYDSSNSNTDVITLPNNEILKDKTDMVFLIKTTAISNNILSSKNNINTTFIDYTNYLSNSISFNSNYIMIIERCNLLKDKSNKNDCQYAYIEIYDGKE